MLPVQAISSQLEHAIAGRDVILVAPPGAGKSTFLPLLLLKHPRFAGQRIIMLQPRRVAVRAIAHYLASQLGEPVGQQVGYRMRGESKVSAATRLEIVTEGLLTRLLQNDPELNGVGLVIFDEFHERSLHADFSLALCLEAKQGLRDDLALLVMSATLDGDAVQRLLPDASILHSEGRSFPIDTRYQPLITSQDWLVQLIALVRRALTEQQGSILVFLPGRREINHVAESLKQLANAQLHIHPLYGDLSLTAQRQALAPSEPGCRKLVLATNIAETSLTIEGINTVVDSGIERVARFHLKKGVLELRSQPISQASATQRAGRAGRLQAGVCYRLGTAESHSRRAKQSEPEILTSDLAPLYLQAAAWGSRLDALPLLDKPGKAQIAQAEDLLVQLGALQTNSTTGAFATLTAKGKAMAELACHPRLAAILLAGQQQGGQSLQLACVLVAYLELGQKQQRQSIANTISQLQHQPKHAIWQGAQRWAKALGGSLPKQTHVDDPAAIASLLAIGFADQIAKARGKGRYQLANGGGATLPEEHALTGSPYLVVANMQLGQHADAWISDAEAYPQAQLENDFANHITQEHSLSWDQASQRIQARQEKRLGVLVLSSQPSNQITHAQRQQLWLDVIQQQGLSMLPWSPTNLNWRQRVTMARQLAPQQGLPDTSDQALLANLNNWLAPYLGEQQRLSQLAELDLTAILQQTLDWPQQQWLKAFLPTQFTLPGGQQAPLHYLADGRVKLSAPMQQFYGLQQHPQIAEGKIALLVELLSPARRPLQTTQDLPGFWGGSYQQVQKEMKGRYPKHYWPDNPATASWRAPNRSKRKAN